MNQPKRQINEQSAEASPKFAGGGGLLSSRSMPASRSAEAAVLGSMALDPKCISEVVVQLKAEAFYHVENQMIFDALVSLYDKREGSVDGVLLRDELSKRGQLAEVGGVEYLAKVLQAVPISANVLHYSKIVHDKWVMREVITAASEILYDAYDEGGDAGEKLDQAEQKIFTVTNRKTGGSASALKDLVVQVYEAIEKRDGTHVTGLATGYIELDEMTCGLQNGEMVIIAGRPSMGKTSLALNMAEHIGIKEKKAVAIFSMEMGEQQLAERFLCSNSGVDAQMVRKGLLEDEHYSDLVRACGDLSEAPIYIDDTAGLTPLEVRAKSRRLKSRHNIQCIIIDYLQLMSSSNSRNESRQQEITLISRRLKALARELNVPVIVLSQLNRAAESREGHRPRMSDLRESGSIEQDADVVMLLHREDYYHRGEPDYEDTHMAEIIIAKQRNGPTGTVKLMFMEERAKFENLQTHIEEPI